MHDMNYVMLGRIFLKMLKFEKTIFHVTLLGNGLNIFQFGIVQVTIITYKT
jgi:hypothetical protein